MSEELSMTSAKWLEYQRQMRRTLENVIMRELESYEQGTGLKVTGIRLVHLFDGRRVALEVKA